MIFTWTLGPLYLVSQVMVVLYIRPHHACIKECYSKMDFDIKRPLILAMNKDHGSGGGWTKVEHSSCQWLTTTFDHFDGNDDSIIIDVLVVLRPLLLSSSVIAIKRLATTCNVAASANMMNHQRRWQLERVVWQSPMAKSAIFILLNIETCIHRMWSLQYNWLAFAKKIYW